MNYPFKVCENYETKKNRVGKISILKILINVLFYEFFMFLKEVSCSPRLQLFDQKYSDNSNTVKYFYNLK